MAQEERTDAATHNGLGTGEDLFLRHGAGAHLDEITKTNGIAAGVSMSWSLVSISSGP